jgi:AraC-like DNA-binding protein
MRLSAEEIRRRKAFQAAFLRRLGGPQPLRAMFDHLPGLSFSVKDRRSRVVFASRPILEKFGMKDELEIVGTTDRDRYPAHLAEVFLSGDREVVALGRPVIDRAEVWYNAQGALDWCVVTKLPLRDRRGTVVGLMAAMRPWPGTSRRLSASRSLERLIERIRRSPEDPVSVEALARDAGISARQLQRRFIDLFGVGVKEFMMRARIHAAAEQLQLGDKPIARVALDAGFCDQSTFTKHFRRRAGLTPAQYRRRTGRTGAGP